MWVQIACLCAVIVPVALAPTHVVALAVGVALASWWVFLDRWYAKAVRAWHAEVLRDPTRHRRSARRSAARREGDHHVAAQALIATGIATATGAVGVVTNWTLMGDNMNLAWALASLAVMGLVIYSSSLVDRYYIRPLVDGVVGEPPCRSSGNERWFSVTRIWYLHRAVAEILSTIAIAVAATALGLLLVPEEDTTAIPLAGIVVGVVVAASAAARKDALHALRAQVIDKPEYWVGDVIARGDSRWYVLHLDVGNLVVRTWGRRSRSWGRMKDEEALAAVAQP
jgi:hypothetical protein